MESPGNPPRRFGISRWSSGWRWRWRRAAFTARGRIGLPTIQWTGYVARRTRLCLCAEWNANGWCGLVRCVVVCVLQVTNWAVIKPHVPSRLRRSSIVDFNQLRCKCVIASIYYSLFLVVSPRPLLLIASRVCTARCVALRSCDAAMLMCCCLRTLPTNLGLLCVVSFVVALRLCCSDHHL